MVLSTTQVNVDCNGNATGSINLTVTTTPIESAPFSYVWSGPSFSSTDQNLSGLYAGKYTVTVTDIYNSTDTISVFITQPDVLSASVNTQTNILCNGNNTGSATVTVTGGTEYYSYLWSDAQTNATANNLVAGPYTVSITDYTDVKLQLM